MRQRFGILCALFAVLIFLTGCGADSDGTGSGNGADSTGSEVTAPIETVRGDWVRVYTPSDPDALHPFASFHASATYVKDHIYQYLADIDPQTLKLTPVLAKSLAEVSEDGMAYTYEIREEAVWDNGSPITGEDYAFSMKAIKNPLTEAQHIRAYYPFVKDVQVDESNPRRFTVITDSRFFLTETALAGIDVISKEFFDPNGLLDQFSVLDFYEMGDELANNEDVKTWSTEFHDVKFKRDPEFIYGSGPYKVTNWTTGDNITLERKSDWWGDKLEGQGSAFMANVDKIIYKTISDRQAAIRAAAAGEIDVLRDIPASDFVEIQDGAYGITENFNLHTPDSYAMVYLGMNCRPPSDRTPFLEDKRVRTALSHLLDVDRVIENIYEGFGKRIVGPVPIHNKNEYNEKLTPIPFDPAKAAQLLDEAGWVDTNGDGTRDKEIKGKRVEFEIEFMVSNSSQTADRVAGMLAKEAEKVGLIINVNKTEFGNLTGKLREHKFDMFGAGFISSPIPMDMRQLWHTESWLNQGSNYFGFGNAHTDSLIEQIRITLTPEERKPLYDELQEIIQAEAPAIFLMSPTERLIIHKRFRNASTSVVRPGFDIHQFFAPEEEQMFKQEAG